MKTKELKNQLKQIFTEPTNATFDAIRDKIDYQRFFACRESIRPFRFSYALRMGTIAVCLFIIAIAFNPVVDDIDYYVPVDEFDEIMDMEEITDLENYIIPEENFAADRPVAPPVAEQIDRFIADESYDFYEIRHAAATQSYYVAAYMLKSDYERLLATEKVEIAGTEVPFQPGSVDGLIYYVYLQNRSAFASLTWARFDSADAIIARATNRIPVIVYCVKTAMVKNLRTNVETELTLYFVYRFTFPANEEDQYLVPADSNGYYDNYFNGRTELVCMRLPENLESLHSLNAAVPEYFIDYQNRNDYAMPVITAASLKPLVPIFPESLGDYAAIWGNQIIVEPGYIPYDQLVAALYALRAENENNGGE